MVTPSNPSRIRGMRLIIALLVTWENFETQNKRRNTPHTIANAAPRTTQPAMIAKMGGLKSINGWTHGRRGET